MRPANPDRGVTCPYGKPGSAWATGEHGGVDYGCPTGDPVYAMWPGVVTGTSWGSAYGTHLVVDHDKLPDGAPGLWAVYAHLSGRDVIPGERVDAGQRIGTSGATGNVSGPHLHIEVQRAAYWQQGNYTDPQPWIDAGNEDTMGVTYDYLEKPDGTQKIGRSYVDLEQSKWDSPVKGKEDTLSYLNIKPTFLEGKTHGAIRVRLMREDGDAHDPHTIPIDADDLDEDGVFTTHYLTYELNAKGKWTKVQVKCIGGLESVVIGTRYTSKAVTPD